ncbi:carbohydrate sulfotransferase 1-like [Antedon mediterranea]|uniref:carbohydrate sulfotransferase 1-like n=1 Tax=Antedon mediterranea TaxID=105859 RepID=UPI003AF7BAE1
MRQPTPNTGMFGNITLLANIERALKHIWTVKQSKKPDYKSFGTKPNVVIILSCKRSGTSFFGELFNQNPDVFYVFEPLMYFTYMALNHEISNDKFDTLSLKMIESISTCDIHHIPYLSKWWEKGYNRRLSINFKGLSMESGIKKISERCNVSKLIAIKTIRVADIALLRDFIESEKANVKVLHLVRDPRAVMNSRWKLKEPNSDFLRKRRNGNATDEVVDLCQHTTRNIEYVSSKPDWLRGKYKLLRYEDVASFPIESSIEIYNFLGIDYPSALTDWLNNNTNKQSGNPYGTSRVSYQIINNWRKEIALNKLNEIQEKCKHTMTSLGYEVLNGEKQLLDIDGKIAYKAFTKPEFT